MALLRVYSSSKRKKRKPTKAELEAQANFEKLQAKWDKLYGKMTQSKRRPAEFPVLTTPAGREGAKHKSVVTPGHSTSPRESRIYSGSEMLGIGQLHKSNMVPVFKAEDAVDIAKMRRG